MSRFSVTMTFPAKTPVAEVCSHLVFAGFPVFFHAGKIEPHCGGTLHRIEEEKKATVVTYAWEPDSNRLEND